MAIADRTAHTEWEGSLARGAGRITPDSGAYEPLPVTWASRTEQADGRTSPEELLAAAHSSCFAMALALTLGEEHARPEQMVVRATVTLDEVDGVPTIVSSALDVEGSVPGMDAAAFEAAVGKAAELCPVSRLFTGAKITVAARLKEG